jgi:hypothetical protein
MRISGQSAQHLPLSGPWTWPRQRAGCAVHSGLSEPRRIAGQRRAIRDSATRSAPAIRDSNKPGCTPLPGYRNRFQSVHGDRICFHFRSHLVRGIARPALGRFPLAAGLGRGATGLARHSTGVSESPIGTRTAHQLTN